jgi:hypothetical protein
MWICRFFDILLAREVHPVSADPAYLRNLRALAQSDPTVADIDSIENELYIAQSDRATAVMLASMVETSLQRLLGIVVRSDLNSEDRNRVFGYEGALGTFGSKIVMAYGLGLIGPVSRRDLDLIREIRNAFAHSRMSIGFSQPAVKAVCDQLKVPDLPGAHIPHSYLELVSASELQAAKDKKVPKTRYIVACHNLAYWMLKERSDGEPSPSHHTTSLP